MVSAARITGARITGAMIAGTMIAGTMITGAVDFLCGARRQNRDGRGCTE
jgi:hypothetical protein